MSLKRRYNWKPDLPDQRDYLFTEKVAKVPSLPKSVDLRSKCSEVFDQGKIGSCTGNSLAGALEFLELQEMRDSSSTRDPEVFDPDLFCPISRLFIYYNERVLEGTVAQDAGAALRDGVKSLVKWGACRELSWKYSFGNVTKKPAVRAYSEAKNHKISQYLKIDDLRSLKQSLSQGYPVAFGFTVYESFESPAVAKTGIMPLPDPSESVLGGHAVLAVGYDDSHKFLWVRNSWGKKWGLQGYFKMPYAYIEDLNLARDFWTIRR